MTEPTAAALVNGYVVPSREQLSELVRSRRITLKSEYGGTDYRRGDSESTTYYTIFLDGVFLYSDSHTSYASDNDPEERYTGWSFGNSLYNYFSQNPQAYYDATQGV